MVGEESAEQWTCNRGEPPHCPEISLVSAAFAGRNKVTDDDEGEGHQAASTHPLQCTGSNELGHVLRKSGKKRANKKCHDRELKDRAPSV